MSDVLAVIAIVVLLVLIVVGLKIRHETRAAERQEAELRAHTGDAQHADSVRRRAETRGTPAKTAGTSPSPPDE
jgi:Tfp pilus assembly protein PilX